MRHAGVDAAVRRWLALLLIAGSMIAFVSTPTANGIMVALALLVGALLLFVSARHAESPFDRMFERRRGRTG